MKVSVWILFFIFFSANTSGDPGPKNPICFQNTVDRELYDKIWGFHAKLEKRGNDAYLATEGDYFFSARRKEGQLFLNVELRTANEKGQTLQRSQFLRGSHEFDRAMEKLGDDVYHIKGHWHEKDNLAQFNRFMKPPHNLSPEEAAKRTWTGQQAAKHGFTEVRVVSTEGADLKTGEVGKAVVYFFKPGRNHLPNTRFDFKEGRYIAVDANNPSFRSIAQIDDQGVVDWTLRSTVKNEGQSQVIFDENELRNLQAVYGQKMKQIRIKIDQNRVRELTVLNRGSGELRAVDLLDTPLGDLLRAYGLGRFRISEVQGTPPRLTEFILTASR